MVISVLKHCHCEGIFIISNKRVQFTSLIPGHMEKSCNLLVVCHYPLLSWMILTRELTVYFCWASKYTFFLSQVTVITWTVLKFPWPMFCIGFGSLYVIWAQPSEYVMTHLDSPIYIYIHIVAIRVGTQQKQYTRYPLTISV